MEHDPLSPEGPEDPAPANKFAALPERTPLEEYIQAVEVDDVDYAELDMNDWLKRAGG
ncbi:MAG: hypothetical protein L0G87_09905 [Renibacterium salmoninarum]|nr:hypothetical protein [Renibacterium salmoninarum]